MRGFCTSSKTWVKYVNRLKQYFITEDIEAAEKKREILLSVVGSSIYPLMRSLILM